MLGPHTHHLHIIMGIINHGIIFKFMMRNKIKTILGNRIQNTPEGVSIICIITMFMDGNIQYLTPNDVQPRAPIAQRFLR